MDNDTYIKTYISKFESVLLDQVRKHVECDTKNTLYASAIQDFQKKLEDAERYGADTKSALDQALNGLHVVTLEKDDLKSKHEKREMEFELICAELEKIRAEKMKAENNVLLLKQEISDIEQKLITAQMDNDTLKNNYTLVTNKLEESNAELEQIRLNKKNKKVTAKESEWIDGDEISG